MSLRAVLKTPGVAGPMASSLLANLPVTALGLLLVLHVEGLTGRFAPAGLAAAAFMLGLGLSAPVVGRLIDRHGQVVVIVPMMVGAAVGLLAIALLPTDAPIAAIVALAGVVGIAMPPGGATVRAIWSTEIPDPQRRHAVFALHTAGVEITYVLGPVVIAGALGAASTRLALGVSVAVILVGVSSYLMHPIVRSWRGTNRTGGFAGPLASPAVRSLLVALLLLGTAFGSVEVGVAAIATGAGHRAWAGPLLGAWGLGSVIGALVLTRRPAPDDRVRSLVRRFAALTVAHAALLAGTEPLVLGPLMLVAGATIAPALTTAMTVLGDAAPTGTLTEAFSWSSCGIGGGFAMGAALGGALADSTVMGPFIQAAAVLGLGTLVVAVRSHAIAAGIVASEMPAVAA